LDKLDRTETNTNFNKIPAINIKQYHTTDEKCEGCYENDGQCFCLNCEKIYCKFCENHIHNVPVNRSHERYNKM